MNNYEVVIGVEIHIELNTKTKMFSSAPNNFNLLPNTGVSVVDLAYPGTLPQPNKDAVRKAVLLAKALNMDIDLEIHFDRKHYFYPDLPKGFQITQHRRPIARHGKLPTGTKTFEIDFFHLEEDTAKSLHEGNYTLLNYNRAGVPLVEIVTTPTIYSAEEAVAYVDAIRKLALNLDISDAKMEEGSLRADINISIRPIGYVGLGTKVEIKNLNSLSNIKKAIEQELSHQYKAVLRNEKILQATKRFDEEKQDVITMRVKTSAIDYRFMPEPNIVPIKLDKSFIEKAILPELPWEKEKRYLDWGIDHSYVTQLLNDEEKMTFFDLVQTKNKSELAKIFFSEIVRLANAKNTSINSLGISPNEIARVMELQEEGVISGKHLKDIISLLAEGETSVDEIIDKKAMRQISDEAKIGQIIDQILASNQKFITENIDRTERVTKFVLGELMKITKGQANPVVSNKVLNSKIKNNV